MCSTEYYLAGVARKTESNYEVGHVDCATTSQCSVAAQVLVRATAISGYSQADTETGLDLHEFRSRCWGGNRHQLWAQGKDCILPSITIGKDTDPMSITRSQNCSKGFWKSRLTLTPHTHTPGAPRIAKLKAPHSKHHQTILETPRISNSI